METPTAVVASRIVAGCLEVSLQRLQAAVRDWPDGEVAITIRRENKARSLAQNAFYWGVCVAKVSEHTGYSPEEVHDLAKQLLLPKHAAATDDNGQVVGNRVVGGSTTTLSAAEMTEFIDRFRLWAAETIGVVIPDPGETTR